jgi:glycerol uptake facilitator-like aquaporin
MNRRHVAEGLGTGLLLYVIVGSGIAAETLGRDAALQLLAHALVVGLGLGVLISLFQTVSGSHFNPSVTLAFWRSGGLTASEASRYVASQVVGAVVGVAVANTSFGDAALSISATERPGAGAMAAEAVATFVLVLVILALVRTGRSSAVPFAVGAWVATIVFATSSTGFANPAVTVARMFTDSYTGIAPASTVGFLVAQVLAGLAAVPTASLLFPDQVQVEAHT